MYQLLQAVKGTAAYEQYIGGVNLYKLLVRVLPAALGRHAGYRSLQDFKQRLLYALAAYIPCNGRVFGLPGYLVYLVDIDDALFGPLYVKVRRLDQLQQYILHVFTHVPRLGQRSCIGDGKGHVKHPGQRLRQQRFSRAGGPDKQYIALLQLHVIVPGGVVYPLVMVVHRHRHGFFRILLADDVLVQKFLYLFRFGYVLYYFVQVVLEFLFDYFLAQVYALIANIDPRARNQPLDLLLGFAAERTSELLLVVKPGHYYTSLRFVIAWT